MMVLRIKLYRSPRGFCPCYEEEVMVQLDAADLHRRFMEWKEEYKNGKASYTVGRKSGQKALCAVQSIIARSSSAIRVCYEKAVGKASA